MSRPWSPQWGKRTYLMGVVNVTPDSFSGDGIDQDPEGAASRARSMEEDGADIIDLGGESTRPGFQPVGVEAELRRVTAPLQAISSTVNVPISIDTSKSEVARRALAFGATIINDVSGLTDPAMASLAAQEKAWLVLVHNRRLSGSGDVVLETKEGLANLIEIATNGGVDGSKMLIDPGLGFDKDWRANFQIISRLNELQELGKPLLMGPSRKGMIARVLGSDPESILQGSLALVSLCAAQKVDVVRVHDVREMSRAVRTIDELAR